jgi:tetratricopeptide (TPR) repeat protein
MRTFSILFLLIIISCQNPDNKKKHARAGSIPAKNNNGTQQMIDSLNKIYQNTNFRNHPYCNEENLLLVEKELQQNGGKSSPDAAVNYAIALLKAGNTEKSLEMFRRLLISIPNLKEINDMTKKFHQLHAVTFMRKGEIDNCIENHSSESCLLPIMGKGIHVNQNGSRSAIEIYKNILSKYPNDLESRWLINLAYMTLDEHPEKVPQQWLISTDAYKSEYEIPKFENIAMYLGIDVNDQAGGCILDDFNNDGFIDIIVSSWGMTDQIRFFINQGDGNFADATESSGLTGITGGLNIRQADYNNDGHVDFFIMRGAWNPKRGMGIQPNSLIKNNGDGTFSDVTIEAGLYTIAPTQTAIWLDYDLDGWLDLFVGNETALSQKGDLFTCEFYHNNGDGSFKDISKEIGMDIISFTKGVATGDINNDGWPDIYLSNMAGNNKLYLNKGTQALATNRFEEITLSANVQYPKSSFPCWFFDFNNDGFDDIFVSSFDAAAFAYMSGDVAADYLGLPFQTDRPRLYLNNGDLTFTDVTEKSNLNRALGTMGCNYGDIDNDGFLDFYLGTGAPDYRSIVPNRMFRNNNGQSFQDVTSSGGFGHIQKGHGISFADLDNDGDSDIYAVMGGSFSGDNFQNAFFENPGNDNKWITIILEGTKANRSAIGSKVELDITLQNGKHSKVFRTVSPGASFGGNSLQLEIGLGKCEKINSIKVKWPNTENRVVDYGPASLNKKVKIIEGKNQIIELPQNPFIFNRNSQNHQHQNH